MLTFVAGKKTARARRGRYAFSNTAAGERDSQRASIRAILQPTRAEPKSTAHDPSDTLQREADRSSDTPELSLANEGRIRTLTAGGQPLSESERGFFEPRFGAELGDVRVHDGAQCAESARALGARAYTLGPNIVFGAGQYAPGTSTGRGLLAHELTHVLQHRGRESPATANIIRRTNGQCSDTNRSACTDEDFLTAICIGEAGNILDRDGKKGPVHVALNRVRNGGFQSSIRAVAEATGQFLGLDEGLRRLHTYPRREECRALVREAVSNPADDPTFGALFFNQSCSKPCDQYCTGYLGDGRSRAHYFARRATPQERAACSGTENRCCRSGRKRHYPVTPGAATLVVDPANVKTLIRARNTALHALIARNSLNNRFVEVRRETVQRRLHRWNLAVWWVGGGSPSRAYSVPSPGAPRTHQLKIEVNPMEADTPLLRGQIPDAQQRLDAMAAQMLYRELLRVQLMIDAEVRGLVPGATPSAVTTSLEQMTGIANSADLDTQRNAVRTALTSLMRSASAFSDPRLNEEFNRLVQEKYVSQTAATAFARPMALLNSEVARRAAPDAAARIEAAGTAAADRAAWNNEVAQLQSALYLFYERVDGAMGVPLPEIVPEPHWMSPTEPARVAPIESLEESP
jgi:hypothetical protein